MYRSRHYLKISVFYLLIIVPVNASAEVLVPILDTTQKLNIPQSLFTGSFLTQNVMDATHILEGVLRPQHEGVEEHDQSTIKCHSQNIVARLNKNTIDLKYISPEYKFNSLGTINNGEISFQNPIADTGFENVVRAKVFNNKFVFGESWMVANRTSNLWPILNDNRLCYGTFELVLTSEESKGDQILPVDESVNRRCKYFSSVAVGFQAGLIEGYTKEDLYKDIPLRIVQSTSDEFIFMLGSFIDKDTKNVKQSIYENCIGYSRVKDNAQ